MFQLVRKRGTDVTNLLWREKYTEAMLTLNPEELPVKIAAAEEAIRQRIEELERNNENSAEELWALNDASRGLRVLAEAECQATNSPKLDRRQRQEAP
jgi:hypothetical protein